MSLQEEIIQELGVKPTIDPQGEIRTSIDFMKAYLKKYPFLKTFVLGISGGQDSTLAGRLAQLAMEEMREETQDDRYQFIAVRLPYGEQVDEEDAKAAVEFIQPDVRLRVNIKKISFSFSSFGNSFSLCDCFCHQSNVVDLGLDLVWIDWQISLRSYYGNFRNEACT